MTFWQEAYWHKRACTSDAWHSVSYRTEWDGTVSPNMETKLNAPSHISTIHHSLQSTFSTTCVPPLNTGVSLSFLTATKKTVSAFIQYTFTCPIHLDCPWLNYHTGKKLNSKKTKNKNYAHHHIKSYRSQQENTAKQTNRMICNVNICIQVAYETWISHLIKSIHKTGSPEQGHSHCEKVNLLFFQVKKI